MTKKDDEKNIYQKNENENENDNQYYQQQNYYQEKEKVNENNNEYYQQQNYYQENKNDNDLYSKLLIKEHELNIKEKELNLKEKELKFKEKELYNKEEHINNLINNYKYISNTEYLQLEVSNPDNKAQYNWIIKNVINNIIAIKLLSYSLPLPRYNIEDNINNIFKYIINKIDKTIIIPSGKYLIDELINYINDNNEDNIKLSINYNQKIIIETSNENDIISIVSTHLSTYNLGFITTIENNKLIANNTWDLRINDKVYLYLNNISDNIPFGILYYNGQSISQFKFQNPFNLDKLEIDFRDSYNNNINFYNLPHTLSFLIEKQNI